MSSGWPQGLGGTPGGRGGNPVWGVVLLGGPWRSVWSVCAICVACVVCVLYVCGVSSIHTCSGGRCEVTRPTACTRRE